MTGSMILVDPHMHLWDLDHIRYPWLADTTGSGVNGDIGPIASRHDRDVYQTATAGLPTGWTVDKVVHVEAGAHPDDALRESAWVQALADQRGFPHAAVAFAALEDAAVAATLEAQAAFPLVRGIRQILNWHPDPGKSYTPYDRLDDPAWQRGFRLLRSHNLSFDLQIYPGQMRGAARLAADNPDTLLILNHTGMPVDRDADGWAVWRQGMAALARQPNVAVKISGLPMLDGGWTVDSLRPVVLDTIAWFGVDRCMVASNFPVDGLRGRLGAYFAAYDQILADFSTDERHRLFAGTAARLYRLDR